MYVISELFEEPSRSFDPPRETK